MLMAWILFMSNLLHRTLGKLFQWHSCRHSEYCPHQISNGSQHKDDKCFQHTLQILSRVNFVNQTQKRATGQQGSIHWGRTTWCSLRSWTVSSFIQTSLNKHKQHMTATPRPLQLRKVQVGIFAVPSRGLCAFLLSVGPDLQLDAGCFGIAQSLPAVVSSSAPAFVLLPPVPTFNLSQVSDWCGTPGLMLQQTAGREDWDSSRLHVLRANPLWFG